MHMGNHHAAASAGGWWWLNKVHGACMDLIGGSSVIWKFDHNIAHHCHSNELGKDNDCEIGNPALRFHPELPRQWFHSFQVFTMMVGMTVGLIKWVIQDVAHMINGTDRTSLLPYLELHIFSSDTHTFTNSFHSCACVSVHVGSWVDSFAGKCGNIGVRFTKLELLQMSIFKISFFLLHFYIPYNWQGDQASWGTIIRNFFITLILGAVRVLVSQERHKSTRS
jgi:hypothetical protein